MALLMVVRKRSNRGKTTSAPRSVSEFIELSSKFAALGLNDLHERDAEKTIKSVSISNVPIANVCCWAPSLIRQVEDSPKSQKQA